MNSSRRSFAGWLLARLSSSASIKYDQRSRSVGLTSGLAVRKLLVWSSGKEDSWPSWPAWLVHFTDYSPDRQAPLDRTLRTARDQNEAMAIADALVLANIKKGWEEFIPVKDNKKTKA